MEAQDAFEFGAVFVQFMSANFAERHLGKSVVAFVCVHIFCTCCGQHRHIYGVRDDRRPGYKDRPGGRAR